MAGTDCCREHQHVSQSQCRDQHFHAPTSYPHPPAGQTTPSSPNSAPQGVPPWWDWCTHIPLPASPSHGLAPTLSHHGGGRSLRGNLYPIPCRLSAASTSSRDHRGARRSSDGGRTRSTSSLPIKAIWCTQIATRRETRDASGMSSHWCPRRLHRRPHVGGRSLEQFRKLGKLQCYYLDQF